MAELIVSVRNVSEARIALAGGAALLDVKEPSRGSLGRADDAALGQVLDAVTGIPISAALGELSHVDPADSPHHRRLTFVKWGLSDAPATWCDRLDEARATVESHSACRVVAAAYADHRRANAPASAEIVHHAILGKYAVVLLDTFHKDGTTLLDWLSIYEVHEMVEACRAVGVRVALAGGLSHREIGALATAKPDWFAVRGAACAKGKRDAELDIVRVQGLVRLVGAA